MKRGQLALLGRLARYLGPHYLGEGEMRKRLRRITAVGLASAFASSWASLAASQSTAAKSSGEGDAETLEEVVVTGYAASIQSQVDAKRSLQAISDSVAADDIGSLPDFNTAEALKRVPGVSTTQDNGEDRFVIVRGFNSEYNFTTVDGLTLPSTSNVSRAVLMDIIPSTAVSRIDVLKSFTADVDGQAIGGRIDLVTRSAFDRRGTLFSTSAALGAWEYDDQGPEDIDPSLRFDGTFSTQFGADDQFGIVVAGNYWKRDTYALSPTTSGTAPFYFYDADGQRVEGPEQAAFFIPENSAMYTYHSKRERLGGLIKLEYLSVDSGFYSYVQGFHFERTDDERRDHHRLRNRDPNVAPVDVTATSGHVVGRSEAAVDLIEQTFEDQTQGVQAGFDWDLGANSLVFKAGYARAELDNPVFNALYYIPSSTRQSFTYELVDDGLMRATPDDPAFFEDPASYQMYRTAFEQISNEEDVFETRLDYGWNVSDGSQGLGIKVGATWRSFERTVDNDRIEYRPAAVAPMTDMTLAHDYIPPVFTVPMLFIDGARVRSLDYSDPALFSVFSGSEAASITGDYVIEEDVVAGYLMGVWNGANYRVSAGVRYEDTDISASSVQRVNNEYEPLSIESGYDDVLPRVDLMYDFTDALRLRAAYSKSIGRADYGDLAPYRTVTYDGATNELRVSGGNPELEPRKADNYDLTLEYYLPGGGGMVALGVFHKQIDDEIFVLRTLQSNVEFDGQTVNMLTTRPENAEGAKISGVEVGVILDSLGFLGSPFLSNFGISANYAYMDSDARIIVDNDPLTGTVETRPLPGLFKQPKEVANVSLFYRQAWFEGRLSYNYTGEHLNVIGEIDTPWTDHLYKSRDRLDGQLRFKLTSQLRLFAEVKNITGSYAHEVFALGPHYTQRDTGRSYWFGATYSL